MTLELYGSGVHGPPKSWQVSSFSSYLAMRIIVTASMIADTTHAPTTISPTVH